jgi:hypothetical protein
MSNDLPSDTDTEAILPAFAAASRAVRFFTIFAAVSVIWIEDKLGVVDNFRTSVARALVRFN